MARSPYIVLVACHRKRDDGVFVYAIFKRRDAGYWQVISGGGEDGENPGEAAKREALEEAAIPVSRKLFKLDTFTHVPKTAFPEGQKLWPQGLYVVPAYYFAVDAQSVDIQLSYEHTEFKWMTYEEAAKILKWQCDVTALWELEQRLQNNDLKEVKGSPAV